MGYSIDISRSAIGDMEEIYNYISNSIQSPLNAMNQYNRIADAILTLDTFPERFRVLTLDSDVLTRWSIRCMPIDNYSVFYTIRGNSVIILAVLYSASNILPRLEGKLS